jgi:L-threonylcarbamoyladenylate synthase
MPEARAKTRLTLEEAAVLLTAGRVVAFPTETVYGLGAVAADSDAVLSVFETKGRPRFNPLIVHCADLEMAAALVEMPPLGRELARRFWPGPLSLVLPKRVGARVSDLVTAGLDTLAVRVPARRGPAARRAFRQPLGTTVAHFGGPG